MRSPCFHPVVLRATLLWSLGVAACATASQGPRSSSSTITRQELEALQISSAYDAVQRLRPQWLSHPTAPTLQARG